MLTLVRPPFAEMPTGWDPGRYERVRRAAKVGLIVWHLLATGTAFDAASATDDVIAAAAVALAAGPERPSELTCRMVRAQLAALDTPTGE